MKQDENLLIVGQSYWYSGSLLLDLLILVALKFGLHIFVHDKG
jgi:hypothetical protein